MLAPVSGPFQARSKRLCAPPDSPGGALLKAESLNMNIHEYQGKELLAKFGVAIPAGIAAFSVEEAVAGDIVAIALALMGFLFMFYMCEELDAS